MRCKVCENKMTAKSIDRYATVWKCDNRHCGNTYTEYGYQPPLKKPEKIRR